MRWLISNRDRPSARIDLQDFAGEQLKITDREIFLAELNVIDSGGSRVADRSEKLRAAFALRFRQTGFDP